MNFEIRELPPSVTFVATPLGRARDITLYALDVLASVDLLVAEDTRVLRKLLELHGVSLRGRRILSLHDHNGDQAVPKVIAALRDGQSVAYASDAGTPLIADPGHDLARAAKDAGFPVTMAPGPSAAIMALALSGQPSGRFVFYGFLPNTQTQRRKEILEFKHSRETAIFYENPRRLVATLGDMVDILGAERRASVCRELTKKFEDIREASLAELREAYAATPPKGEVVLVLGPSAEEETTPDDLDAALREALKTMRIKDAATAVAGAFNLARRDVYQRALTLEKEN